MNNIKEVIFPDGTTWNIGLDDAVIIIPKEGNYTIALPKTRHEKGGALERNDPSIIATVLATVISNSSLYHQLCDEIFGSEKIFLQYS